MAGNGTQPPQGLARMTPSAGAMVRQGFDGSMELSVTADVHSNAIAAQLKAEVEARYTIARHNPRDIDLVRTQLLNEARRPGFAASARYSKPVGGGKNAEGPTIRFVEAALRVFRNTHTSTAVISETMTERRVRVMVQDVENNNDFDEVVTVSKTVEKRDAKGRQVLSERTNSSGQITYLVAATDDELTNKQNALVSKAIRNQGLRLLPGDIVDEAQQLCIETVRSEIRTDPAAARKRLVDSFSSVGVDPIALKAWLGHPVEQVTPGELAELREIFAAIRDGETRWAEVMDNRNVAQKVEPAPSKMSIKDVPEDAAAGPLPEDPIEKKIQEDKRMCLEAIGSAKAKKSLQQWAPKIEALPSGADRDEVMAAYTAKMAELSKVPEAK